MQNLLALASLENIPGVNPMNPLTENKIDVFMSVRQVSNYLHLNEKKVYALVKEGHIPATKITGKWMFPKELVDRWMLDSTHNGLLHDRLIISGSDDPLLYRIILEYAQELGNKALITYTSSGTRAGLDLLNASRVDACCIHWGPEQESRRRHPSLIQQYKQHHDWIIIRAFKREQGLIFDESQLKVDAAIPTLFDPQLRWSVRHQGSGSQRFLLEILSRNGLNEDSLNITSQSLSEREAATAITLNKADVSTATRATANEFNLDFISLGWQAFDLVIPRNIWFRHLFQNLLQRLNSDQGHELAHRLGGYQITQCGELIWGQD